MTLAEKLRFAAERLPPYSTRAVLPVSWQGLALNFISSRVCDGVVSELGQRSSLRF